MNGFLLIDKPSGISSSSCVYSLRKLLNKKRIGHCGTLDPLATGVLPICIGEATKFSNYVSDQTKEYRSTIKFGIETDTGDIFGKEISRKEPVFSENDLRFALEQQIGTIEQTPPMYSALKVNGKPLYYWARRGIYLKRNPRIVVIDNIELLSFEASYRATIKVSCTKGTYIRSLVKVIGRSLGTNATVMDLRRTKVGSFSENDLYKLGKLDILSCKEAIIDCDSMLEDLPKVTLNILEVKKIRNGQQVDYNAGQEKEGIVRIYEEKGSFIGLGNIDSSMQVSPVRLLSAQVNSTLSS